MRTRDFFDEEALDVLPEVLDDFNEAATVTLNVMAIGRSSVRDRATRRSIAWPPAVRRALAQGGERAS